MYRFFYYSGLEDVFILKPASPEVVLSLPEMRLLASGNQLVEKSFPFCNQASPVQSQTYTGAAVNYSQWTLGL